MNRILNSFQHIYHNYGHSNHLYINHNSLLNYILNSFQHIYHNFGHNIHLCINHNFLMNCILNSFQHIYYSFNQLHNIDQDIWYIHCHCKINMEKYMNYISNLKGMFFHLHYILCIKYLIYRSYKVKCKECNFFQNTLLYINHNYLLNCISNNSPHILNNFTQLYSMHLDI